MKLLYVPEKKRACWVISRSRQVVLVSVRGVVTGGRRAHIRWFVFDCHCELLEGQLGPSDTTGLKKANRGEASGAFKRERHPDIKRSQSDPILPFTVA